MNPAVGALGKLLGLNTRLFENCLRDVTDELARRRLTANTNSLAFVGCHLVDARCLMGAELDHPIPDPFHSMLEHARSIDDIVEYPSVIEIETAWTGVTRQLYRAVECVEEARLRERSAQRFPVEDESVLGGFAFLVQHESYHIGQMAMLRKALGRGAMEY